MHCQPLYDEIYNTQINNILHHCAFCEESSGDYLHINMQSDQYIDPWFKDIL